MLCKQVRVFHYINVTVSAGPAVHKGDSERHPRKLVYGVMWGHNFEYFMSRFERRFVNRCDCMTARVLMHMLQDLDPTK